MFGFKSNANSGITSDQKGMAGRKPFSTVEIMTELPVSSIRVIGENRAVTTLIYTGSDDPVRSTIQDDGTVKDVEIVIDQQDPCHVTVITY